MTEDEPSFQRLRSLHYRVVELDSQCMDSLHHLMYETDSVEVDFETVEDLNKIFQAMKLMGKPNIRK